MCSRPLPETGVFRGCRATGPGAAAAIYRGAARATRLDNRLVPPGFMADWRRCGWAKDSEPDTVQARSQDRRLKMAQKVPVGLEDDLIGGAADETVRFAFEGTDYEIDLNAKNAAAFHKQLASYIQHAHKAGQAQPRQKRHTTTNRQRSNDIRAWAKERGLAVD